MLLSIHEDKIPIAGFFAWGIHSLRPIYVTALKSNYFLF
jgi:hypothetical protein